MSGFDEQIRTFIRKDFDHEFGKPSIEVRRDAEWEKIRATGSRLWLDTGDLDEASALWNSSFDALTTNNTLLNKEIQKGLYDDLVAEAATIARQADVDEEDVVLETAFILNAYHGLRLVERFDANVSVELHTDLAHDVERTVAYGKRYFAVCPERFYVKVPLTPAGFLGARKLVQAGIPINFTLGFSARHNYVAALLTEPAYVNVFMGRLNAFVADHGLGSGQQVGEKATLATQRELRRLREEGRSTTSLIGASIRSGEQVGMLAGVDVLTIPTKAAAEYRASPRDVVVAGLEDDPDVPLEPGITFDDFGGATLWDVPKDFRKCVEALLAKDLGGLGPEELVDHFAAAGFPGFLPRWSKADIETVSQDGKIPDFSKWKERLASGELGLDALMNISALQSFATDQKALDDRIRSLL